MPARINGEWTLELPAALGRKSIRLAVTQQAAGLTGQAMVGATMVPLEKLLVRGEDVTFTIPGLAPRATSARFTGKASGDSIEGTVSAGGTPARWRATRTVQ